MASMDEIAAVVLAAGCSRRMRQPKVLLPWGRHTVLEQVLHVLEEAGVRQRWVIGGAAYERIEAIARQVGAGCLYNAQYAEGEMLSSIQVGLRALEEAPLIQAALICLGDQPQIEVQVVRRLLQEWEAGGALLIVPSYQQRRGHPWLIAKPLWPALLALRPPQTARDFLRAYATHIRYVLVETDSILQDIDTPEEYERFRPRE